MSRSGGPQHGSVSQRFFDRLLTLVRALLHPFGDDKLKVCNPDEAKDGAEIGLQVRCGRPRRAVSVEPAARDGNNHALTGGERDRPEMWGIMTIGIGPAGYVAGWGFADGMDAAFGRDGD
jgi:hypothetical protein